MYRIFPLLLALPLASCSCQRTENVEAKKRLSAPPPPDPLLEKAAESIAAGDFADNIEARDRASLMRAEEIAARLKGYVLDTSARLQFSRGAWKMKSKERVHVAQNPLGSYSVRVETGNGGLQQLVFINDILFLKNNNGRWRASRDPRSERSKHLNDSVGIWKSFYAMLRHALVFAPPRKVTHSGRPAFEYQIRLPDDGAAAREIGRGVTPLVNAVDGGPQQSETAKAQRVTEAVKMWRKRAKPAGGKGVVVVDEASGVLVVVKFKGKMLVGDGPEPARLDIDIDYRMSDIGGAPDVRPPKEAIDEIVRKKRPVDPYGELEKKGLLPKKPAKPKEDG